MIQVLLHVIIDELRGDDNRVFKMTEVKEKRWWQKTSLWITFARVGLPVAYILVALAIVMPGILNILKE